MSANLNIPLHGSSVDIVRKCGPALSEVLHSKFGCMATIDGVEDLSVAQQNKSAVVPEKRFEFRLPAGVQVSVWKGDLTNWTADAVVNAANERLQHYGGLAKALSRAGGPQIQKESDDYISKYGGLRTGDAIITGAGSLPCKKIIHAVGPQLASKSDLSWAEDLLKMAIWRILTLVEQKHLKTVAIPAISSGIFNYPLPQCAEDIVTAVKHYYERSSGPRPKEIHLVNHDEPTVKEMERACRQLLSPHQPPTYSQAAAGSSRGAAKTSPLSVQMGSVHLTLKKGKLEEERADVIVNTIGGQTSRNLYSGAISKALLLKAGDNLQKEMYSAAMGKHVIVTKGYKLHCHEVYHTFCPMKGLDPASALAAQQNLLKSVSECLWVAASTGHKSIAFPAIGTGGLGFDKKEVAHIMSTAVDDFAQGFPQKMDVYFVIFPHDNDIFKAFEEQMRSLQRKASPNNFPHETERRDDRGGRKAPSPQISLSGPSEEATREADQWLQGILFRSSELFTIRNNFILHCGENELQQLSRLMKKHRVSIEESFDTGRASIIVSRGTSVDVAVAGLQVEALLINIQNKFVEEEESEMFMMTGQEASLKRETLDKFTSEFSDRKSAFNNGPLQVVKVDRVENGTLKRLFEDKKKQLDCFKTQKMFQLIPAQFIDMVSRVGFHAEFAPPDDPKYGEGIYFASSINEAMRVWKEPNKEYLHFVEAEVLTGESTSGQRDLILPPFMPRKDPPKMFDSVGGPGVSVIFSGYQALPKYIITCKTR